MFRRLITTIALAASLVLGVTAGAVGADAPEQSTFEVTFPDINPCTQQPLEVTITFHLRTHRHNNNEVSHFDSTVVTSEGHLGRGTENQVVTSNGQLRTTINFMNTHPTTRERFTTKGHLRLDTTTGEVFQSTFRMRCIRPAT